MPIVRVPDGRLVRFPDDMPKEEIKGIIAQKFPENKHLELTEEQRAKIQEAKDDYNKKGFSRGLNFIKDALWGFGEGVEAGFNRLDNAATLGAYDWLDRNYLNNTVGNKQKAINEIAENEGLGGANTVSNMAVDIGGAGYGGAGKIATKIADAGIKGLKALALENSLIGSAFGATSSDKLEDLPSNIISNAVLANILGLGTLGAGKLAKFGYDTAFPYVNAKSSSISNAVDKIGLGKLRDLVQKAQSKGRSILEVADDDVLTLAQEARQQSPKAYQNIEKAVENFNETQNARNSEAIDNAFGNRGKYENTDEIIKLAQEQAAPIYDKLQIVGDLAVVKPELKAELAKNPFLKSEINAVRGNPLYRAEYGDANMSPTDWRVLDQTNRSINDKITAAVRAGENDKVRLLERQKYNLLDKVDEILPEYKIARGIYEAENKALKAQKIGEDALFDNNTSADKLARKMQDMTDYEKRSLKVGAREKLLNTIESKENQALGLKKVNNEQTIGKLKLILGDKADDVINYAKDETKAMRNLNKLTKGSQTSEKQSIRDKMNLFSRISKNPWGMFGEIGDSMNFRVNNARNDVLSQMLSETNGSALQKEINNFVAKKNATRNLRNLFPIVSGVGANEILKID